MGEPLLRVEDIACDYRGVFAVTDVSLSLPAGGITAVIGANGAGKTTIVKAISGAVQPRRGRHRRADLREQLRALSPPR